MVRCLSMPMVTLTVFSVLIPCVTNWKLNNDTIHFISGEDTYGIPYRINEIKESEIKLQLMEDITLTLTRRD